MRFERTRGTWRRASGEHPQQDSCRKMAKTWHVRGHEIRIASDSIHLRDETRKSRECSAEHCRHPLRLLKSHQVRALFVALALARYRDVPILAPFIVKTTAISEPSPAVQSLCTNRPAWTVPAVVWSMNVSICVEPCGARTDSPRFISAYE